MAATLSNAAIICLPYTLKPCLASQFGWYLLWSMIFLVPWVPYTNCHRSAQLLHTRTSASYTAQVLLTLNDVLHGALQAAAVYNSVGVESMAVINPKGM
jgi:hypothetical protein